MARIRTIKPEFWLHEELSSVSETAALLAIALLNYADDEGYFRANPSLIKAACFPLRETSVSVPVALLELSRIGYVEVGEGSGGKAIGRIVNFDRHQRVSKPSKSTLKAYFEPIPVVVVDGSVTIPGILPESSRNPPGGKGNGKEVEEEGKGSIVGQDGPTPLSETDENVLSVLTALQEACGRRFTLGGKQAGFVRARLKEGATVEELALVVAHKCAAWAKDPKMREYLRPETLFCAKHWEAYLIAAQEWDAAGRPDPSRNGKPGKETVGEAFRRLSHGQ